MSKGCELLSKALEHKFSGREYKIYRGERENPSRKRRKNIGGKDDYICTFRYYFWGFQIFFVTLHP